MKNKKTEYRIGPTLCPVGDIEFVSYDRKRTLCYNPKEDITPYELSKIINLMAYGVTAQMISYDWFGYIESNNLLRHFDEK